MQFERAAAVLRGVEQAPALGIAAPLASVDLVAADAHAALPQTRLRAARSWLFALGYLTEDRDRPDYDPALKSAVARFQEEAGLVVDGWIGEGQTWPRLQELVTFEEPLQVAHWTLESGSVRPALTRAVDLRLSVYGLDGAGGLPRFRALLGVLGIALPQGGSQAEDYAALLDHDSLLAEIAASLETSPVRKTMEDAADDSDAVEAFGLLLNFAKVELWLAQEAKVSLSTAYRGRLRFGRDLVLPGQIKDDMSNYMAWVDEEIPGISGLRQAYRKAIRAEVPVEAVRLFLRTAAQHGQVAEPFAPDRLELLDVFYGGKANAVPRRAEETVKVLKGKSSFRSRLWDGLRRLWSWMKTALARAIATGKHVLKLARDLAAYVFRATTEGLRLVARAIGAFVRHADTAIGRTQVDPRGWVGVRREFGRDVSLFVSPRAREGYVAAWTSQLAVSAAIFRRAASVLGDVVALGLTIAGLVIGGPLVLRSLLQVVRDLRQVLSVLDEIAQLQARHDALGEEIAVA